MKIKMVLDPIYSETEFVKQRWGDMGKKFLGYEPKIEVSIKLNGPENDSEELSVKGDNLQECIDLLKVKLVKEIERQMKWTWREPSEFDFSIEN